MGEGHDGRFKGLAERVDWKAGEQLEGIKKMTKSINADTS